MPTLGMLSVAQQRVALVVLLGIIVAAVWWQQNDVGSEYRVEKFAMTPLPDVIRKLDFTHAESAWSGLQIDPQGNLRIDALTETALLGAIALTQDRASNPDSELAAVRISLLLEKQFGALASRQIMALLPRLQRYKESEQRWWEENGSRDPAPLAELFQLQDKVFGPPLANELFSEQRRLAEMMLASQRIRNDASLTQAEKDRALNELQKTLQAKGASVE